MALTFEQDDVVFGVYVGVILAFVGFVLGIVLDVMTVSAAAFAPVNDTVTPSVKGIIVNAGLFPLEFLFLFLAAGFLGGLIYSAKTTPP